MSTILPALHTHVVLADAEDRSWRTRIEALDPYALTVARPFDLPLHDGPVVGAVLEISWAADGGTYTLPVELVETAREGVVALWVLAPRGEVTRAQRRAHFRLAHDAEVRLATEEQSVTGHLVDISEAAVRVRVSLEEAALFADGVSTTAAFDLRQDAFDMTGSVLRSWPSERQNGEPAVDVVVLLHLSEAGARELRRALLAEQVHRRRLER